MKEMEDIAFMIPLLLALILIGCDAPASRRTDRFTHAAASSDPYPAGRQGTPSANGRMEQPSMYDPRPAHQQQQQHRTHPHDHPRHHTHPQPLAALNHPQVEAGANINIAPIREENLARKQQDVTLPSINAMMESARPPQLEPSVDHTATHSGRNHPRQHAAGQRTQDYPRQQSGYPDHQIPSQPIESTSTNLPLEGHTSAITTLLPPVSSFGAKPPQFVFDHSEGYQLATQSNRNHRMQLTGQPTEGHFQHWPGPHLQPSSLPTSSTSRQPMRGHSTPLPINEHDHQHALNKCKQKEIDEENYPRQHTPLQLESNPQAHRFHDQPPLQPAASASQLQKRQHTIDFLLNKGGTPSATHPQDHPMQLTHPLPTTHAHPQPLPPSDYRPPPSQPIASTSQLQMRRYTTEAVGDFSPSGQHQHPQSAPSSTHHHSHPVHPRPHPLASHAQAIATTSSLTRNPNPQPEPQNRHAKRKGQSPSYKNHYKKELSFYDVSKCYPTDLAAPNVQLDGAMDAEHAPSAGAAVNYAARYALRWVNRYCTVIFKEKPKDINAAWNMVQLEEQDVYYVTALLSYGKHMMCCSALMKPQRGAELPGPKCAYPICYKTENWKRQYQELFCMAPKLDLVNNPPETIQYDWCDQMWL